MKRTCVKVIPQRARADPAPLPVLMPVMVRNPNRDIPENIKKYVGRKLEAFSDGYAIYGKRLKNIAELQIDQFKSLEHKIGSVKAQQDIALEFRLGPALKKHIQKSKLINDYIRKETVKHIEKQATEVRTHISDTNLDSKQDRTITTILYKDNKKETFITSFDKLEERLTELESRYSLDKNIEHEPNNFPESSQELTNSNYSLEDVIADAKKPKIKKRRGKENKITLIYDSPNPAKVELRPKDIGSLELTIFSRGMDAQEIREKTLVFDPYNPETNEKNVEIFLDEVDTHYANNTLDSLITSLNNPGLAEYFGKNMSPHFKKIYDLMTDELNSEFKGENKDLTSNLLRVKVEKNKKRSGYGAFSSGKKLFGALSPILFPLKLLPYVGRIIE